MPGSIGRGFRLQQSPQGLDPRVPGYPCSGWRSLLAHRLLMKDLPSRLRPVQLLDHGERKAQSHLSARSPVGGAPTSFVVADGAVCIRDNYAPILRCPRPGIVAWGGSHRLQRQYIDPEMIPRVTARDVRFTLEIIWRSVVEPGRLLLLATGAKAANAVCASCSVAPRPICAV